MRGGFEVDVNQLVPYGFVLSMAFFAVLSWQAHRNLREVLNGLKEVNGRTGKLDRSVSSLGSDVRQIKEGIAKKVEHRSLERIFDETIAFIERNSPAVAVAESRVPARR